MTSEVERIQIYDGHNDVLQAVHVEGRSFFDRSALGHLDLPRARAGGFAGGLFSVWLPPGPASRARAEGAPGASMYDRPLAFPIDQAYAVSMTMSLCSTLLRLVSQSRGELRLVTNSADLNSCLASGQLAVVMHFEGAEPIDPDLNALDVFYAAGLRCLGVVWSRPNVFGTGVPLAFPRSPDTGPGLTDAGRGLVRACNTLGIVVDVSHLNERGFWDVAAITNAPIVATHSNAHAITPWSRNLTDRQLDAIKESDGIIGVNFSAAFCRGDGQSAGKPSGSSDPNTPISCIVDHFRYLVDRIGIDHVGFGSDFDGTTVPEELADAAGLPRLVDALRGSGFNDEEMRKLAHANWVRVLTRTWKTPA